MQYKSRLTVTLSYLTDADMIQSSVEQKKVSFNYRACGKADSLYSFGQTQFRFGQMKYTPAISLWLSPPSV